MKEVLINTEFIKLGQLLKLLAIIDSGALAKEFLAENDVLVNDLIENRRGRKLYDGDILVILGEKYIVKAIAN